MTSNTKTKQSKGWEIFGWACYDFANSAFTTIIVTVVFAEYFTKVIFDGGKGGNSAWGWSLAISQLAVVALGPWLGAMADHHRRKKFGLMLCALACIVFTALLGFTAKGTIISAMVLFIIANFAFSLGENFTASFLPHLSTPETAGRISAYGWSFGYFGGLVSLVVALVLIKGGVGLSWVFVATGVFMLLATLPTALLLKEPQGAAAAEDEEKELSIAAWLATWKELKDYPALLTFLIAFGFFMMGLTAVVAFAAIYTSKELSFTTEDNIKLFIFLQISAAIGAFAFGWLQDRIGSANALSLALVLWIVVAVSAFFCSSKGQFMIIGNLAGLAMGSTQSASRALVSLLAPPERSGEFFGFWGVFGKLAACLGPVAVGMLSDLVGIRWGVLCTGLFFGAGWIILLKVSKMTSVARKAA